MKNCLFLIAISCIIFSCAIPADRPNGYKVPKLVKIPHEEVMKVDYPTKKAVFLKFGTPTNKETFENIENWYFKLSEVTSSNSIGFSSGTGLIYQNPLNPYLNPVNRSLVVNQSQINSQNTKSTTVETFVKFWFVNDSVSKWETLGVDYSKMVPNNNYDEAEALKSEKLLKEWEEKKSQEEDNSGSIILGSMMGALLIYLLVFN